MSYESVKKFYTTKKGVVTRAYGHQREKSKRRGYEMPKYTNKELRDWAFSQPIFHRLYEDWVSSNYKTSLKPSFDRINDYKTYSLDNIRITTVEQNCSRYYEDAKNGLNTKMGRVVLQTDLDGNFIKAYPSINIAAREMDVNHSSIASVCKGINKTCKGYKWEYAD